MINFKMNFKHTKIYLGMDFFLIHSLSNICNDRKGISMLSLRLPYCLRHILTYIITSNSKAA